MDEILSLYETVVHSDCRDELLFSFLSTCSDHRAFLNKAPSSIQSVVANINSKLNSPTTRYEGLLLLKTYIPQCSTEVFGENAISWMQQCLKSREGCQNKHAVVNTSYQVLKMLLQMSEQMPDLKRPISGHIVPKIIDSFQQIIPQEASLPALECLEVLMFNYGPSCGQQKNILESCVLQYVDSDDRNVIKSVARCVTFLPLVGGGGSLGANHVVRWKEEQQKICATLHQILDELFDNIREIPNSYDISLSAEELELPPMTENSPLLRVHHLTTRFVNVSKFLQSMLVSVFPVEKKVLPDTILGVVCRGLAVTSSILGKKVSTDLLMVGAVLPQIHIALLKVLDSLIVCCGRNMLPYAPVICKLALQTFKWTSVVKWPYGTEKPYGQLRVQASNTLTLWLQTANGGSCVELVADELISLLIQDVQSEKETVTLVVHGNKSANLSKKHKKHKKQASGQEFKETIEDGSRQSRRHIPDQRANNKICKAALQVLQWMLHCAATFIKPNVHRLLQEMVVGLLFEIQRTNKPYDFPVPYVEVSCRLELYRLLHTLTLEPHPAWPPPLQFALRIFSAGRSDPNLEVSGFCTSALVTIEKLVHPACGTLQFPVPLEEMLESTRTYKQQFPIETTKEGHLSVTEMDTEENINRNNVDTEENINRNTVDAEENINRNTESAVGQESDLPEQNMESAEKANDGENSDDDIVIVYEDKLEIGSEVDEAEEESDFYDTEDELYGSEMDEMNDEIPSDDDIVSLHSDNSGSDIQKNLLTQRSSKCSKIPHAKGDVSESREKVVNKLPVEEKKQIKQPAREENFPSHRLSDNRKTSHLKEDGASTVREKLVNKLEQNRQLHIENTISLQRLSKEINISRTREGNTSSSKEKMVNELEQGKQLNLESYSSSNRLSKDTKTSLSKEDKLGLRKRIVNELDQRLGEVEVKYQNERLQLSYKNILIENEDLIIGDYKIYGFLTPDSENDISIIVNQLIDEQRKQLVSSQRCRLILKFPWYIANRENNTKYFIDLTTNRINSSFVFEYKANAQTGEIYDSVEHFLSRCKSSHGSNINSSEHDEADVENLIPACKLLNETNKLHKSGRENEPVNECEPSVIDLSDSEGEIDDKVMKLVSSLIEDDGAGNNDKDSENIDDKESRNELIKEAENLSTISPTSNQEQKMCITEDLDNENRKLESDKREEDKMNVIVEDEKVRETSMTRDGSNLDITDNNINELDARNESPKIGDSEETSDLILRIDEEEECGINEVRERECGEQTPARNELQSLAIKQSPKKVSLHTSGIKRSPRKTTLNLPDDEPTPKKIKLDLEESTTQSNHQDLEIIETKKTESLEKSEENAEPITKSSDVEMSAATKTESLNKTEKNAEPVPKSSCLQIEVSETAKTELTKQTEEVRGPECKPDDVSVEIVETSITESSNNSNKIEEKIEPSAEPDFEMTETTKTESLKKGKENTMEHLTCSITDIQPVNGLSPNDHNEKEVTEEEMLNSFVDVVATEDELKVQVAGMQ